ncbi:MAG: hypothetical protein ACJAY8_001244 [Sphingobacteriales bacterium]|jgi:hypothetical protein
MEKRCSKCGANFECTNDGEKCWCAGIEVETEVLKNIYLLHANCLCSSCLKQSAEEKEKVFF